MQLSKYSPSIINIKENPHKVHNRREKKTGTYFKLNIWTEGSMLESPLELD
jgi:hypothetical protein